VAAHRAKAAAMTPALRAAGLTKAWGGFHANQDVDLQLEVGARHALIGPNGAGKTTFVNLLTGVLAPSAGKVFIGEEDVTRLPQHERVRRGMARTYQISNLFPGLTVAQSVVLAICERKGLGTRWFTPVERFREEADEAHALLEKLHLEAQSDIPTRSLPYGKQRLVEIALALALRPKILLLDEPAAGIPSGESADVLAAISALPRDVTILFIEHDMELVMRFAERISVLVGGRLLTQGTPAEIARDARVREVYLGEAGHG
jgi:branched-chain amino acid transport system ATP-binding protein